MNLEELQIKISIELKELEKQLKSITKSIDKTLGPKTTKKLMQDNYRVIKAESIAINRELNKAFEVDYKSFNNNLNAAMNQAKLTVRSACNDIRRELNSALNVKANIRVTGKTSIDGSATGSSGSTTASSMASSQYIGAMIIKATNAIIKNDNSNTSRLENTINKSTKEIVSAIKNIKIDSKPTHINSGNNKDVVKAINTSTRDIVSAINNINTQDKKTNQKSTTTKKSTSTERNEPKQLTNSRQGQKALTTSGINFDLGEAGKQISAITKEMKDAVKVINIFKRNFSNLLNDFNTKQLGTGSYGNNLPQTEHINFTLGKEGELFIGTIERMKAEFKSLKLLTTSGINFELGDTIEQLVDIIELMKKIHSLRKGLYSDARGFEMGDSTSEYHTGSVKNPSKAKEDTKAISTKEIIIPTTFKVIDDELKEQVDKAVNSIKQISLPTDVFNFDTDEIIAKVRESNEAIKQAFKDVQKIREQSKIPLLEPPKDVEAQLKQIEEQYNSLFSDLEFYHMFSKFDEGFDEILDSPKKLIPDFEQLISKLKEITKEITEEKKFGIDTSKAESEIKRLRDLCESIIEDINNDNILNGFNRAQGTYKPPSGGTALDPNKVPEQQKKASKRQKKGNPPKPTTLGFGFGAYKNEIDMLIEYAKKAGSKIKQALFGKKDGGSSIPDELAMTIDDSFNDEINEILDNIYNCLKSISADVEAIKSILSKNYVAQKETGDSTSSKSSTFDQFKKAESNVEEPVQHKVVNKEEDSLEKRLLEDDDLFEEHVFDALVEKINSKMNFVLDQDDSKALDIDRKLKDMYISEGTPVNIDDLIELGNYIEELKRQVMSDKLNKSFDIDVQDTIDKTVLSDERDKITEEILEYTGQTKEELGKALSDLGKELTEMFHQFRESMKLPSIRESSEFERVQEELTKINGTIITITENMKKLNKVSNMAEGDRLSGFDLDYVLNSIDKCVKKLDAMEKDPVDLDVDLSEVEHTKQVFLEIKKIVSELQQEFRNSNFNMPDIDLNDYQRRISKSIKRPRNADDELAMTMDDDDSKSNRTVLGFGFGAYKKELELLVELAKKAASTVNKLISDALNPEVGPKALEEALGKAIDITGDVAKAVGTTIAKVVNTIDNGVGHIIKSIESMGSSAKGNIGSFSRAFSSVILFELQKVDEGMKTLGEIAKDIFSTIGRNLKSAGQQAVEVIGGEIKSVYSIIKSIASGIYKATDAVVTLGLAIDDEIITSIKKLGEDFITLGGIAKNAFAVIGRNLKSAGQQAVEIMGDGLKSVGSTIKSIASGIYKATDAVVTFGLALDDVIIASVKKLGEDFVILGNIAKNVFTTIGRNLKSAGQQIIEIFSDVFKSVSSTTKSIANSIYNALGYVAKFGSVLSKEIGASVKKLGEDFVVLGNIAKDAFDVVLRNIKSAMQQIAEIVSDKVKFIGTAIKSITNGINKVFGTMKAFGLALGNEIGVSIKKLGEDFVILGNIAKNAFDVVLRNVKSAMQQIAEIVADKFKFIGTAISSITNGVNKVFSAMKVFGSALGNNIGNAFNKLKEDFVILGNIAKNIFDVVLNNLKSAAQQAVEIVSDAVKSIYSTIKSIAGGIYKAFDVIVDYGMKLCNEIGAAFRKLGEDIKIVFGVVGNAIKKALDPVWDILSKITTSLGKAISSIRNFAKAFGKEIGNAFKKLKEDIATLANTIVPPLQKAFSKIGEAFWKSFDVVFNLFNVLVDKTAFVINRTLKLIQGYTLAIGRSVGKALQGIMSSIGNALQKVLTPIVQDVVIGVKLAVNSLKEHFNSIFGAIKSAFNSTVDFAKNSATRIKDAFGNIVGHIKDEITSTIDAIKVGFNGIVDIAKNISSSVKNGFNSVTSSVKNVFNSAMGIVNNAKDSVKSKFNDIADSAKDKFNNAAGAVKGMFNSAMGTVNNAKDSVKSKFNDIADSVKDKFNNTKDSVKGMFNSAANTVNNAADSVKSMFNSTVSTVNNAKDSVKSKFNDIADSVKDSFNSTADTVKDMFNSTANTVNNAKDSVKSKFNDIADSVKNKFNNTVDTVKGKFSGISEVVKNTADKVKETTKKVIDDSESIVKKSGSGISKTSSSVANEIKDVFEQTKETIKSTVNEVDKAIDTINTKTKKLVKDNIPKFTNKKSSKDDTQDSNKKRKFVDFSGITKELNKIKSAVDNTSKHIKASLNSAFNSIKSNKILAGISNTLNKAKDSVSKFTSKVRPMLNKAFDSIKTSKLKNNVSKALDKAKGTVSKFSSRVRPMLNRAFDSIKTGKLSGNISNALGRAKGAVSKFAGKVRPALNRAFDGIKASKIYNNIVPALNKAKGAVSKFAAKVGPTLNKAFSKINVSKIASGIGKGLNGAKKVLSKFASGCKSLWGKIKSIFHKGSKDSGDATGTLKGKLKDLLKQIASFATLASLIALGKEAIQQSTQLAQSEVKLASLMKQRMGATNETITAIRQLAEEQAKLGVVSETAMKHGAQQLARYVHSAKALKTLMPAIANLTATRGGVFATEDDAEEIATQLGEAIREGTTTPLEQSGIYLSEAEIEKFKALTTEEARAKFLADEIAKSVGNINQALANTPHGAIAQLKNNFQSLLGTLGIFLANVIKPIVQWLNVIVVACNNALKALGKLLGFDMTGGATTVPDIGTGGGGSTTPDIDTGGIDDAKDAYDDAKDAADEATEANEKFKGSLMGFDELNILSDNTQKDSDSEKDPEKDPTDITPGEGGQLLPEVGELTEGDNIFDKFSDKMKAFIDEVLEPFKNAWDLLGDRWKAAWADLIDSFKNFCDSLARFLKSVWENGGKEFVQHLAEIALACGIAAMEIGGTILDALAKLWDHLDPEKNMHTQRLLDVLNEVSVKARDFILGLNEHLENLLEYGGQEVLNAMGDCFMDLAAAFVNTCGVIIDAVDGLIDHLDPKFNVDTRNMLEATADMFHAVGQAAWDFSELLKSALENGGQDMINALGTCVVNLGETVARVITTMMESFSKFFDYIDPKNNDITRAMMKAWEDAFYAIGDAALQLAELFDSIMDNGGQELLNAIGDLGMQILETFGNIVEEVADCIGNLFKHLDPAENKTAKNAIDSFKRFIDSIREFVRMFGDALDTFMESGGQEFVNNLGDIIALIVDLATTIAGGVIDNITAFFDSWAGHLVLETVAKSLEIISGALEWLLKAIKPLTPIISDLLTVFLGYKALTGIASAITSVVTAIGKLKGISTIVDWVGKLFTAFKNLGGASGILTLVKGGFTTLWGVISAHPIAAIITAIAAIGIALYNTNDDFKKFIDNILGGFKGVFDKIKEYGGKLLDNIKEIFGSVIDIITGIFEGDGYKVGEAVRNLITNILELIYNLNQSFVEIGWELIKGLVKGIWECIKNLPSLLAGFCEFVVDFFKGLFGIHSPSTVFAELGVNLIEGLIEGIKSMFDAIGETISNLVDSILEAFNTITDKLSEIWNNVKDNATEIWTTVKDTIVDKCKETYDKVKEKYENIRDTVSDKLKEVKEKSSDAWTKIKDKTSDIVSKMKDDAEDKYSKLKDKLTDTMENWRKNSEDKWNKIKEKTASLVDTLKKDAEDKYNKLKDKLTDTMDNWKKNSEEKWNNIKDKTSDLVSKLKDETEDKYNKFKDKLTDTMEDWRKNSEEKWTKIKEKTTELAEDLKSTVEDKYDKFKEKLSTTLENLRKTSEDKWNDIKEKANAAVENLKTNAEDKFNTLKTNLASKMSDIKSDMETKWNSARDAISKAVETMRTNAENSFNTLKTNIGNKIEEVKTNVVNKWGEIKTETVNKVNEVVKDATAKYGEIKTNFGTKMDELKSSLEPKWENLKTAAKTGASKMLDGITSGLSNITKTITKPFEDAKTAVQKVIQSIGTTFKNANWSFPKLKLPHLKVSGSFSLNPPKVPSFSVEWYKRGGIIDGITPLGFTGSTLHMGGEAGKEMVVPLENTSFTTKIANAMGQAVDNAMARNMNSMYGSSYNTINDNRDIVLQINDREFARASINSINKLQRESGRTLLDI